MTYELAIFVGGLASGMWIAIQIHYGWERDIELYEDALRRQAERTKPEIRTERFSRSRFYPGSTDAQWWATDGPGFSRN